jgi:hypothetical protein
MRCNGSSTRSMSMSRPTVPSPCRNNTLDELVIATEAPQ